MTPTSPSPDPSRRAFSRRDALRTAGAASLAAGLAAGVAGVAGAADPAGGSEAAEAAAEADRPGRSPGRIDTHQHLLTDAMRDWAVEAGLLPPEGGPTWADWTLDGALATMDTNGIAAGVVSAPVPSMAFHDRATAERGVRVCNESMAELVADHPTRFGFFANVAPLHTDLALDQIAYALDELGADGVILMTSADGRYLGDPAFDPLFAELNRRRAVVLTHPESLPEGGSGLPGVPDFIADFMFDTTRMALNLIASGTLDRYPDVSIILSHAGGFLPYVAGRAESAARQGEGLTPGAVAAAVQRFYYDTAMPASPYAMPSLLAAAGPSRILFGTDWPARPADEVRVITRDHATDPTLDRATRRAVDRTNALRLLPRLASRLRDTP
ncbi:amidohydrolase family protein [Streptomyces sp. 4N509B]|uniref:amidohydrolase family protein n=1 Tax=Streptomyces sp. 4N509B TaxID=3457413 RepID=UPI003FD0C66E